MIRFLDICANLMGPALIAFALGLIGFCTFVYFRYVVPFYDPHPLVALPLSTIGVFLLFNVLYNYYKAVVVSPGIPPLAADAAEAGGAEPRTALGNRLRQYDSHGSSGDDEVQSTNIGRRKAVCGKCSRVRPPRTHHCSVCGSCIYRFDHHCPWIYNCVGLNNFKYFYLFLFHLFLVDLFFVSLAFAPFRHSITRPESDQTMTLDGQSFVIMSFVLAAAVEIAIAAFLGFHTYLLLTNKTTMEWATGGSRWEGLRRTAALKRNPYDLGRRRNWEQIFGKSGKWKWAFPFLHDSVVSVGEPMFPTIGVTSGIE